MAHLVQSIFGQRLYVATDDAYSSKIKSMQRRLLLVLRKPQPDPVIISTHMDLPDTTPAVFFTSLSLKHNGSWIPGRLMATGMKAYFTSQLPAKDHDLACTYTIPPTGEPDYELYRQPWFHGNISNRDEVAELFAGVNL